MKRKPVLEEALTIRILLPTPDLFLAVPLTLAFPPPSLPWESWSQRWSWFFFLGREVREGLRARAAEILIGFFCCQLWSASGAHTDINDDIWHGPFPSACAICPPAWQSHRFNLDQGLTHSPIRFKLYCIKCSIIWTWGVQFSLNDFL